MEPKGRKAAVQVDPKFCKECGICVAVCPQGALGFFHGAAVEVEEEKCVGCGICVQLCPDYALSLQEGEE